MAGHHTRRKTMSIQNVDIVAQTHTGLTKQLNEDRYLVRQMDDRSLLMAVADGLGGGMGSDIAAERVRSCLMTLPSLRRGKEESDLYKAALDMDQEICRTIDQAPELEGMATTLVCAVLRKDRIYWVNVGDSRLYVLREGKLLQVTEDQTLARFLVAEGEISEAQAKTHYSRDVVDQCLGYGECQPETSTIDIQKKDIIILSTDGLFKMVPEDRLKTILTSDEQISVLAQSLVISAMEHGGKDNVTIVIARINQTLS